MNRGRSEQTYEEDLAWCYDAVQGVSRTFAITIAELNEPTARDICVGYLLCRVADTVEDAGHIPPSEQAELLRLYDRALDPEDPADVDRFREAVEEWIPENPDPDDEDDWAVVAQSPRVVRTFEHLDEHARESIRPPVRELVGGMALFVERYAEPGGLRIRTIDELEEYCWYAAGTVGTLITDLVSRDAAPPIVDTLRSNARSFALLLQLVNVAKDVADDYEEENNIYLPEEWLREEGVDPDDVCAEENVEKVASVVLKVTRRAEGYLDDAQRWLEAMPETRGNTLSAWAIPFLLAVGTIRELEDSPEDVVEEGGVKVTRAEVRALIAHFAGDTDRSALEDLRTKMRSRPLHEY